jgi:hypothetical protein
MRFFAFRPWCEEMSQPALCELKQRIGFQDGKANFASAGDMERSCCTYRTLREFENPFPPKKNREFIIVQRFNRPNRTGPSPKRTLVYGIAPMCIPRTLLRSSFGQVNQLQLAPFLGVFARIDYHASVQRAIFVAICAS